MFGDVDMRRRYPPGLGFARLISAGLLLCASVLGGQVLAQPRDCAGGGESWLVSPHAQVKFCVLMQAGGHASDQPDYLMAGLGDGLGVHALDDGRHAMILMNHELQAKQGKPRAHGERGAFVSRWKLDRREFKIVGGEDLIQRTMLYDPATRAHIERGTEIERLCSADLPVPDALAFREGNTMYGTQARIFFSGEEISSKYGKRHGRAFAHVASGAFMGTSYELPRMGRMSFENIVLHPQARRKTIAMLLDDSTNHQYAQPMSRGDSAAIIRNPPSELYMYIGEKLAKGDNPVERAGLDNGELYGIRVAGVPRESREFGLGKERYRATARFETVLMDEFYGSGSGERLQAQSIAKGVTQFLRVEDGAWNSLAGKYGEFYFATTDTFHGISRLFRLRFDDMDTPLAGGVIEIVINGEKNGMQVKMLDNLTVDPWGRVLLQEDPGYRDNDRLARIWLYRPDADRLSLLATSSDKYFGSGKAGQARGAFGGNEETTGIIHAFDTVGEGWYLLSVQAHARHPDMSVVEYAQLLAMYVPR